MAVFTNFCELQEQLVSLQEGEWWWSHQAHQKFGCPHDGAGKDHLHRKLQQIGIACTQISTISRLEL